MKVYRYRTRHDTFQGIIEAGDREHEKVLRLTQGIPLGSTWRPVRVKKSDETSDLPECDFPGFWGYAPVFSQRAWEVLQPLIKAEVEALPIEHPSRKQYFLINVLDIVDCLDLDKCETNKDPKHPEDGISAIYTYSFKEPLLCNRHIFKCPEMADMEVYVSEEFKELVLQNGLVGLALPQIYPPILEEKKKQKKEKRSPKRKLTIKETPLPQDVLKEFDGLREYGYEVLDLGQSRVKPDRIVAQLDELVDALQNEDYEQLGLTSDDEIDLEYDALWIGTIWGDQFVEKFGWEWVGLSVDGDTIYGVVSPDRSYVVFAMQFVSALLENPSLDNTMALIFNMTKGKDLNPSGPKQYISLTDGHIQHIIPKE